MEKKKKITSLLKSMGMITAACVLYAAGISLFLDPNSLAPGGVTGVAILLNRITGLETGLILIILNIPIMALAIMKFGFRFLATTVFSIAISSLFVDLFALAGPVTSDPILAAVAGAVLIGVSMGIIFRAGATTGGADIIVKLLRRKFKHIKTGALFMVFDGVVVTLSGIYFKNADIALYAGITVILQAFILDLVLYGADGARMLHVISEREDMIAARFMEELDTGVTYLSGTGAYTNTEKKVLLCVMRKQNVPRAREIILEEDINAFLIISSANSVFGEGYRRHDSEDL